MCWGSISVWIETNKNKKPHSQCGIRFWDQFTWQQFRLNRRNGTDCQTSQKKRESRNSSNAFNGELCYHVFLHDGDGMYCTSTIKPFLKLMINAAVSTKHIFGLFYLISFVLCDFLISVALL